METWGLVIIRFWVHDWSQQICCVQQISTIWRCNIDNRIWFDFWYDFVRFLLILILIFQRENSLLFETYLSLRRQVREWPMRSGVTNTLCHSINRARCNAASYWPGPGTAPAAVVWGRTSGLSQLWAAGAEAAVRLRAVTSGSVSSGTSDRWQHRDGDELQQAHLAIIAAVCSAAVRTLHLDISGNNWAG